MPSHPVARAKLLVVDDNPTGRFVICDLLRTRFPDCEVLARDTARAAFGELRHERIDAIVCHRARRMGDVDLVRALRTINAAVPIVAVSDPALVGSFINAGATKFVRYGAWTTIGQVVAELLSAAQVARPGHEAGRPAGRSCANRSSLKVVVAHDDDNVRASVCTQFAKAPGVAVHGGGDSGIDGLQLVRSVQPDLAVLDITLLGQLDLAAPLGLVGCFTQFVYLLAT